MTLHLPFKDSSPDTHWALRGHFVCDQAGEVTFECVGASWYEICLDGEFLCEGPLRFDAGDPRQQRTTVRVDAGRHVLAVHLHDIRLETRLMQAHIPPFLSLRAGSGNRALAVEWKTRRLDGYRRTGRRLGCVLGWPEWEDTRRTPADWRKRDFTGQGWEPAVEDPWPPGLGAPAPDLLAPLRYFPRPLAPSESGPLMNLSMVEHDPPMNFVVRDLDPRDPDFPANGRWWRADLGRIQLGRPRIELEAPAGALVQIAYAESLTRGRVFPYLAGGGGSDSCMLDTWIARGGRQEFRPLHPKGARFLEIHVLGDPGAIRWIGGEFTERCYYPETPEGSFTCGDPLLEKIWDTGVATLRSCAEDAVTDNPARERGQWLGDATGPGMHILACSYRDHGPLVRGLRQAAHCAGPDGLIPAIFPGTRQYIPSFAIQWVAAVPRYHRLSGDRALLEELLPAARTTLRVFEPDRVKGGLRMNPARWNFIDWGYLGAATEFRDGVQDAAVFDPALSLFYLEALRALENWETLVGADAARADAEARTIEDEMRHTWLARYHPDLGFHASALALRNGLVDDREIPACVAAIKRHILDCFPINPDAPRLESVHVESPRLITPYFLHYVLPVLIEHGEAAFVYDVIRRCWGWMLGRGVTTWYEVFDHRWSHCHQWSGCPTWILTRYAAGLRPRFDLGHHRFELDIHPGGLRQCRGTYPLPAGGTVQVEWRLDDDGTPGVDIRSDKPVRFTDTSGLPIFEGCAWTGRLPTARPLSTPPPGTPT